MTKIARGVAPAGTGAARRMGRPPADAPSRRDAILDAALDLFIERGLGAATMGEVAARAGASKATLYKLFPDTGALLDAAIAREVDRGRDIIAEALRAPDLARALSSAMRAMLAALDDRTVELFRLVISEAGRRPDLGRRFHVTLFAAAAGASANRIAADLDLPADAAAIRARQLVGAVKEPLFYPRLMGVAVESDPDPVIDRAVRMTLLVG